MRYAVVLFDMDNTLFDYDRGEAVALQAALEGFGVGFVPEYVESYRRINRRVWQDLEQGLLSRSRLRTERFERLFGEIGVRIDAEAFAAQYLELLSRASFLVDGAADTVAALRGRCRLGLVSNGFASVQYPRLRGSGLADSFDGVVISEEVGVAKPDPRIFDHALEALGRPERSTVLMVGDSLSSDMEGARRAGIDGCWYNPSGAPGDGAEVRWEVSALLEVVRIVEAAPGMQPTIPS